MIKDIILNLETEKSRDSVCGYAISVAEAFDAHLAGVAFAGRGAFPVISCQAFHLMFSMTC